MFQNLKSKNAKQSVWRNMPNANNFHVSPGATFGQPKGNEADRMVRCRVCGFPCDKERDMKARPNTWAGLGISQGAALTAGTSIGDRRVPAAGAVGQTADTYYNRTITGGCPCCGCLIYWT